MRLKKLIKKINKENTPPGGWRPEDKVSSHKHQAASAHKEIGFKNFKYYLKKRPETNTIKK
jgi:hypothetical protein